MRDLHARCLELDLVEQTSSVKCNLYAKPQGDDVLECVQPSGTESGETAKLPAQSLQQMDGLSPCVSH